MRRKSRLFAHSLWSPDSRLAELEAEIGENLRQFPQIFPFWGDYRRRRVRAGLPPEARSLLALPSQNTAEYVSEVRIPAGTQIQYGVAAGAFNQPGGGIQIQLLDRVPASNFGPGKALP